MRSSWGRIIVLRRRTPYIVKAFGIAIVMLLGGWLFVVGLYLVTP